MKKRIVGFLLTSMLCFNSTLIYASAQELKPQMEGILQEEVGDSVVENQEEVFEDTEEKLQIQAEENREKDITDKTAGKETEQWNLEGIAVDKEAPQQIFEDITFSAKVTGADTDLQYKFVWMKENWKEWGVIRAFSDENTVVWAPQNPGEYQIFLDVKDSLGKVESKSIRYGVSKAVWSYEGIMPDNTLQKVGVPLTLSVNTSGNTKGLQYKYVWERENWKEWGVIRAFSGEEKVQFVPDKPGIYNIIVDIRDSQGNVVSESKKYKMMTDIWSYDSVETNIASPQEKYSGPVQIKTKTSGENEGLEYKYVWMKNGWKEWGVIQEYSKQPNAKWVPEKEGIYTLFADVRDVDGNIITKTLVFEITKVNWNYDGIEMNPSEEQKKQENVEITALTSGNTEKLQYKFVWMKDNWKSWGVIQNFSEKNTAIWITTNKIGEYKIFVDVRDRDGEVRTKDVKYFVVSQIWEPCEININNGVQEKIYTKIPVSVNVNGETQNLKYKFVWKKGGIDDGWSAGWGVIQEFAGKNSSTNWYPKKPGKYTIYTDIEDVDGRRKTLTKEYDVLDTDWTLEEIDIGGSQDRFVGEKLNVTVKTSGNTEGLQYKFVCRRGTGWGDWEIVQEFSENNSIDLVLSKNKDYTVYVDIKDQRGVIFDAETVTVRSHKYNAAKASSTSIGKGKTVNLYPDVSGGKGELQYKYVWMKNNWKEWGVIKEFSSSSSVNWTPAGTGKYVVYIDVKANDIVQSKSVNIEVKDVKNGWYYEGGYKFYYKNGVKQLDLDGILSKQSSYWIKVNRKTCSVTVYAKDGSNGYIIPVKRFACSVGLPATPTITGTYYTPAKYRWHTLMGPSYGQYCTRINGGYLFHSVAGRNMTSYNLSARDYNKLGEPASHGCVRLCVRDAKWIYDNCPLKTKVTIYDSSDPGPLGKPATIKIPASQTWDPTDPNI